MTDVLASRREERERLIERARGYAQALAERLPVRAVVLTGSVARGDFNLWSDIDVLVVADALPAELRDRQALLTVDAPGGVQVFGFTPAELQQAAKRRNRLVLEALAEGLLLAGHAEAMEPIRDNATCLRARSAGDCGASGD